MTQDKESSVVASLNKLSDLSNQAQDSSEQQVAKVKRRGKVKEQKWMSDDSAGNLLEGLLGETSLEAEAELKRKEEERKAREAAEAAERAAAEAKKKANAEERLREEQNRLQEVQQRRTQMLAAIERQKKIETGEIDVEEEERLRKLEEERLRQEEEAKRAKEAELQHAQSLIQEQQSRLQELANRPLEAAIAEPRSNMGIIVGVAAAALVIGVGVLLLVVLGSEKPEDIDPFALVENFPTQTLTVTSAEGDMAEVGLNIVSQSAAEAPSQIAGGSTGTGTKAGRSTQRRGSSSRGSSSRPKSEFDGLEGKGENILGGSRGGGIVF